MYNLDTRLHSLWIAQQAHMDYYSRQPYADPRANISEIEAQKERERARERANISIFSIILALKYHALTHLAILT